MHNQDSSTAWQEVWLGLTSHPPSINPKWFYDAAGSALFDAITRQPEYYPTEAEKEILTEQGDDIAHWIGPDAILAELGAGNGEKGALLLRHLERPAAYVPVDISGASMEMAVSHVRHQFPELRVEPMVADFFERLPWPTDLPRQTRCLVFLGSTIGNMDPTQAENWLSRLRTTLRPGCHFLIGVDLKKDPEILNAAYNDAKGVTAAFNLNALSHLNRAIGTTFHPHHWHHYAAYNPEGGRVEMHVVAQMPERIRLGDGVIDFRVGDRIHTEYSYKYTVAEFQQLARGAGYRTEMVWTDTRHWFSLHGLTVTR